MKQRNLIITGAIFLLLLIYVLITQTGNKGFNTLSLPEVTRISSEEMEKIVITRPGEKVVLAKEAEKWQIIEPISFPADKNKIESVKRMLGEIHISNVVTERTDVQADYGLNSMQATALLIQGAGKKVELTLGTPNDSKTHTYVQLPGDQKIYQLLGDFTQQLARSAKDWRSLRIYEFSTAQVRNVTITRTGKPRLTFFREKEVTEQIVKDTQQKVTPAALPERMVWKEKDKGIILNDPKVNQWLNNFTRLAANLINDELVWKGKPLARIRVEALTGEIYELEILKYLDADQRYQVRHSGEDVIYEIGRYQGDNLLKTLEDLK